MVDRCRNPNNDCFDNYGGRGIAVCERWHIFSNFLADMGERPDGTTLDRIDNDGDYTPENCRWASVREQLRNRRVNRTIRYRGKDVLLIELAERLGLERQTLANRVDRGWSEDRWSQPPNRRLQHHSNGIRGA